MIVIFFLFHGLYQSSVKHYAINDDSDVMLLPFRIFLVHCFFVSTSNTFSYLSGSFTKLGMQYFYSETETWKIGYAKTFPQKNSFLVCSIFFLLAKWRETMKCYFWIKAHWTARFTLHKTSDMKYWSTNSRRFEKVNQNRMPRWHILN